MPRNLKSVKIQYISPKITDSETKKSDVGNCLQRSRRFENLQIVEIGHDSNSRQNIDLKNYFMDFRRFL